MKHAYLATDCIANSSTYSLINSVAFHPSENVFCATFSTRSMLIVYAIDDEGRAKALQKISGSKAGLSNPQHAIFSRDGERIITSDWSEETFTIHARLHDGSYEPIPANIIPFPERLAGYKPHGMEMSPSGQFIAAAFGASAKRPQAIASFRYEQSSNSMTLITVVEGAGLAGIPKGICFSPDGTHLLVTFSDAHSNCISLYSFGAVDGSISESPCQSVQGSLSSLSRPEDIKVSHEGNQLIVSNSGTNAIAFYRFSGLENRIVQPVPEAVMDKNSSGLEFPHGLAVSPCGSYLVASQFGPLEVTADEDILFGGRTPTRQAKIWVFRRSDNGLQQRPRTHWPWTPWLWQLRDRLEKRS